MVMEGLHGGYHASTIGVLCVWCSYQRRIFVQSQKMSQYFKVAKFADIQVQIAWYNVVVADARKSRRP